MKAGRVFLYPFLVCLLRADGLFLCLRGGGYANSIQNPGHHRWNRRRYHKALQSTGKCKQVNQGDAVRTEGCQQTPETEPFQWEAWTISLRIAVWSCTNNHGNCSLQSIADSLDLNPIKIRKLLITTGVYFPSTAAKLFCCSSKGKRTFTLVTW